MLTWQAVYLEDRLQGKFPMWMLGWGSDNGDPDNYIGYHFAQSPDVLRVEDCYKNDELGKLLVDGSTVADTAQREEIYKQAEQIVHDDVAHIPVVWATTPVVFRSDVMGYEPVVFRSWYENIWIDSSK